jgi:hypothetical protein
MGACAVNNPFMLAEERSLFNFTQETDFQRWKTFQDKDVGGRSTISLEPSVDNPVLPFSSAALI